MTEEQEKKKQDVLKRFRITEQEWHDAMKTLEVGYLLMSMVNELAEQTLDIFRKHDRLLGYIGYLFNNARKSFDRFDNELKGCITDGPALVRDYDHLRALICDYLANEETDKMDYETSFRLERQKVQELEHIIELYKQGKI